MLIILSKLFLIIELKKRNKSKFEFKKNSEWFLIRFAPFDSRVLHFLLT